MHPHVRHQLTALLTAEQQVCRDIKVVAQRQVLPDDADPVSGNRLTVPGQRPSSQQDLTAGRRDIACQAAHQRGLAGPLSPASATT